MFGEKLKFWGVQKIISKNMSNTQNEVRFSVFEKCRNIENGFYDFYYINNYKCLHTFRPPRSFDTLRGSQIKKFKDP